MHKKFEIVKCIASDKGWEHIELNPYCIRIQTKTKRYLYDVWTPVNKKTGEFLGYTIHNWEQNKYDRKVQDFEKYINENNRQRARRN